MNTPLTSATVLRTATLPENAVPCRLDGDLVPACDFPRCFACKRMRKLMEHSHEGASLAEITAATGLDAERTVLYAQQALSQGWLELADRANTATSSTNFTDTLQGLLSGLEQKLGTERAAVLWARAENMVKRSENVDDWLIALQLSGNELEARVVERLLPNSASGPVYA